ncbi:benzyl alcohol O-benzoyltransferase-like [Triticum dicoccoides]|uniref:benzyl alcohol O-benzoyltransferase-like n=1 Tax=Triticum dicoccoides TaxID=85692 RepID=UPI00162D6B38|nr:benzyl alcohol O-benzoyltransferase-like [Triticum dicoccoides]
MASPLPAFVVRRATPELVVPSAPTPHEAKPLSDIDDAAVMRFYSAGVHLYRGDVSKEGQDPARVIREALAKALVPYYPLAGRLREEAGRKLVVECYAQGVLFVEADADLTADDFGDIGYPPFPCYEQFVLEDTAGTEDGGAEPVVDRPLFYVQVTRLKCGGFIFGHRVCHCMVDAPGCVQFVRAIAELARGADAPSVPPVWGREMLMARQPQQPSSYPHLEFQEPAGGPEPDRMLTTPPGDKVCVPFLFGPREIAALRQRVAPLTCSRFELVAACVWQSRTAALGYAADDEVRLSLIVNVRGRPGTPLPAGFYGNAFAYSAAATTAGELCSEGLGHAVELVKKAKSAVTYEHLLSLADLMVATGRPLFAVSRTCILSDVSHAGFKSVDVGWGEAVYAGPVKTGEGPIPGLSTYFLRSTNGKGEEATVVPVCLPKDAMDKFRLEVQALTAGDQL